MAMIYRITSIFAHLPVNTKRFCLFRQVFRSSLFLPIIKKRPVRSVSKRLLELATNRCRFGLFCLKSGYVRRNLEESRQTLLFSHKHHSEGIRSAMGRNCTAGPGNQNFFKVGVSADCLPHQADIAGGYPRVHDKDPVQFKIRTVTELILRILLKNRIQLAPVFLLP